MILKCNDCGLAISIREEGDYIVLSETERLPKKIAHEEWDIELSFL